jgi:G protein-coupled receptor 157
MHPKCLPEVAEDYFGGEETFCPRRINCTELLQLGGYETTVQEQWPSMVAIVSCTLSVLGSLLIVYAYVRWKDLRTGSRSIVTYLAIADLVTALGYIAGSANYILHFGSRGNTERCRVFDTACQIQSFVTTTSSLCSFAWTLFLAVYLYLVIVKAKLVLANKLIPLFHVVAWGVPLLITLPLLIMGKLGYSPYAASNWCFVKDSLPHNDPKYACGHLNYEELLLALVGGKAWEITTYVLVIVLYAAMKWHIHKETREAGSYQLVGESTVTAMQRADKKLTFIPVVFILLRIWGTAQFLYATSVEKLMYLGCVPNEYAAGFTFLAYVQVR